MSTELKDIKSKLESPEEKLQKRISREIKKCKYIGDIIITDEEYQILIEYFKQKFSRIVLSSRPMASPLIAVALVQIGIRYYDGGFWTHVKNELNIPSLAAPQQASLGKCFYKTLQKYGKLHVEENEFVNNILLHCFITNKYADDLFDFLFAYYQIDLDRDLSQNNKDMRNYLMQSMKKGEESARTYKIKRHTADAATANDRGCRIRVARILKLMDNALFNGVLPANSSNRISQLFIKWTEKSKKFLRAQNDIATWSAKGQKRFSSPYIKFDYHKAEFNLILPRQYIRVEDEEDLPEIQWKVSLGDSFVFADAVCISTVTGCKTEQVDDIEIEPSCLFGEIKSELIRNNNEIIRKFKIKADCCRLFDEDLDMINYSDHLPCGQIFAFTEKDDVIISESVIEAEITAGVKIHHIFFEIGDIARLPDGRVKSAGKPLEEGLLNHAVVDGAFAVNDEKRYRIFKSVPSIYFRMKQKQENGTFIEINKKRFRFDIEKCMKFETFDGSGEYGYILKLENYISDEDIYDVVIDIPNSNKNRTYPFALIKDFEYTFDQSLYVFKEGGTITIPDKFEVFDSEDLMPEGNGCYSFDILPDYDIISFDTKVSSTVFHIEVDLPALKWKFDGGEWETEKPEEIWHAEFPNYIYLKGPFDNATFSMVPFMHDDDSEEEIEFSADFKKSKQENVVICDTRKMLSWFGFENALRHLNLEINGSIIDFALIITRCFCTSFEISENFKDKQLVFKGDIHGFSDCFADIWFENDLIAEKEPVTVKGIKLNVPFKNGMYRIEYFETDDEDDDDFGITAYRSFYRSTKKYVNKMNISNKVITLNYISEITSGNKFFAPEKLYPSVKYKIMNIAQSDNEAHTYIGKMFSEDKKINGLPVKISFVESGNPNKMNIAFYSPVSQSFCNYFHYELNSRRLITDINRVYSGRLINLSNEKYCFYATINSNERK